MNFLAPLFLAGAAAVLLPIVFHLVRRSTRVRLPFSSLMFLRESPPRLSRRSRVEHWLLLILRAAALVLLALAFARPFLSRPLAAPGGGERAERWVVLLDTSASMQRAGYWDAALSTARRLLEGRSALDQVAVYAFSRDLYPVMTFEEWHAVAPDQRAAVAQGRLTALRPGWGGTRLGQALISAAELAVDPGTGDAPQSARVIVISDLQEGGRLNLIQGHTWPNGLTVELEPVNPGRRSNASLQLLTDTAEGAENVASGPGVRLRVSNESDAKKENFTVQWANERERVGTAMELYVPAGQSRSVFLPAAGTNAVADRVRLSGDEEPFDNVVFVSKPAPTTVEILYLGNEAEADARQSLYYLRRALQGTPRQVLRLAAQKPGDVLTKERLQETDLLIVTDAGEKLAAELRTLVDGGKTLLYAPKSSSAAAVLMELLGAQSTEVEEVRLSQYAMLAEIDFRHPLFAPFADPRFSDFTKIHFWRYRRLEPLQMSNARVLAKFDNGDPAILEVPLGRGRVFVLASGWHPEDSQLALSSKFVPMLYALVELSGAPEPTPLQHYVGESVKMDALRGKGPVTVTDGREKSELASVEEIFVGRQPGLYKASEGEETVTFAVNLDPAESRTVPHSVGDFEELRAPLAGVAQDGARRAAFERRVQQAELENEQKLWRWVILACLGILIGETWLAGRAFRLQS